MLNQPVLDALNASMAALCEKYGFERLVVENYANNVALFRVPKQIANDPDKAAQILKLYHELIKSVEGVRIDKASDKMPYQVCRGSEQWEIDLYAKRGYYTITQADDDFLDYENSDEAYEKWERQQKEDRIKYWEEYLLPIPKPSKNAPEELFLTMAYEPYDWIKNGEKDFENRAYTPNWVKRIIANRPKRVRFQRGYGGPGRPKPEQMVWTVKNVMLYNRDDRRECDPWNVPRDGFAPDSININLGERVE